MTSPAHDNVNLTAWFLRESTWAKSPSSNRAWNTRPGFETPIDKWVLPQTFLAKIMNFNSFCHTGKVKRFLRVGVRFHQWNVWQGAFSFSRDYISGYFKGIMHDRICRTHVTYFAPSLYQFYNGRQTVETTQTSQYSRPNICERYLSFMF